MLDALATASETPERLWNRDMALTTAEEVAALAAAARLEQVQPWPSGFPSLTGFCHCGRGPPSCPTSCPFAAPDAHTRDRGVRRVSLTS